MKQKSLKKNMAFNLIRNAMTVIYPLITFPYASRVLLSDGIGKYEFANSIVAIFLIIANLGIGAYATREMARIRDKVEEKTKFAKEVFVLNLFSTFFAYSLLVLALFFIPTLESYRKLLLICSGRILFTAFGLEWIYTAFEDYDYIAIRSVLFQILSIVLLFIFVRNKDDYIWYAGIGVFSTVGSNICNFIHSKKYIHLLSRNKNKLDLKKHIKPILIFFGMNVAVYIYTMLDTTMLGFFTDTVTVGYYTAANRINRLVLTLITAIAAALSPRISYLLRDENNKTEDLENLINKSIDFIICFSIPSVLGLIVLSPQIVLLFCGTDFVPAILPMQLLTPVLFVWSLASILDSTVLVPMRKEKYILYSQISGAVTNFLLNFLLIKRIGLLGAIVSTLIAESLVTAIQFLSVRKIIVNKHFIKNLVQVIIASLFMLLSIFLTNRLISNIFLNILFTIFFGILSYAIILFFEKNEFFMYVLSTLKRGKKT